MHRLIAFAPLLTAVCLSAQQPAPPSSGRQDPPQPRMTFKVDVSYIEIDATVTASW